jgi:hypothetical protein
MLVSAEVASRRSLKCETRHRAPKKFPGGASPRMVKEKGKKDQGEDHSRAQRNPV